MGCGCKEHSKGGFKEAAIFEAVEKTRPMDQCIACTQKHICEAYAAYNEFTYETVNRAHIIGQLQLAIHHSYRRWPNLAGMAREISHLVQAGDDAHIGGKWDDLLEAVGEAYYAEHSDALERIGKLKEAR